MVKLNTLLNPNFVTSLSRLTKGTNIPMGVAFKIKRLAKQAEQEVKHFEDLRNELIQQHSDKDESGKAETVEADRLVFNEQGQKEVRKIKEAKMNPESRAKFDKALEELRQVDVDMPQIVGSELPENIMQFITPFDLLVLDGVLIEAPPKPEPKAPGKLARAKRLNNQA